ncbi:MAG TPA: glycosidase, partial [Acidimicrobiia bacterium]|nr:glycosidase [Acidimicrobiia bacterium]
ESWELVQAGNCGSPIETDEGWLVLMHGVGPMRRYVLSAVLLDLDEPTKVLGRLRHPLLEPSQDQPRNGYVPNVVYSCGGLVHAGTLVVPYGESDTRIGVGTVPLSDVLAAFD